MPAAALTGDRLYLALALKRSKKPGPDLPTALRVQVIRSPKDDQ